jgi:chaperonin GroES
MKLKPLGDHLIVRAIEEEATASGIVLGDTEKDKPLKGKVIAVGEGKVDEYGQRIPLDVSEGDEVLYSHYGGTLIEVDGDDLLVLRESDVLVKAGDGPAPARRPAAGKRSETVELRESVAEDIERLKQLAR